MFDIPLNSSNMDMRPGPDGKIRPSSSLEYYRKLYSQGRRFKPRLPLPPIETHQGFKVVRCDLVGGFKALAAEKLIATTPADVLVYCAPRVGHASVAIAKLAQLYGKKAVFFAPASRKVSDHQKAVLYYDADLRFIRIAAMPNLNRMAKDWAELHSYQFLPFGLAHLEEITAGIVKLCDCLTTTHKQPKEHWCAVSTGTMIRGLQIAFPGARARGVAVARNLHPGEIGRAKIVSSELPFLKACKYQPPFPTTPCYDAKAWEVCVKNGSRGAWFFNVGSDDDITKNLSCISTVEVDSWREWGDLSDLERGI